ncbi:MAG: hypothetical protein IKD22_00485 [Lentisphaeria bacterium]|nr:hypothetical protein [Lentisphaeria bacterium]
MLTEITLNYSQTTGKIRPLNGGNLGPCLKPEDPVQREDFKLLEIPLTRLHDAPHTNSGMRLVDIHQIFGNWNADPEDPDNYYFEQTDEYIRRMVEDGTPIMYRLGISIEHCLPHYYTRPPADFHKWANICLHIIRHYNEGWANGMHANIQYWEIWNEPDDCRCFAPNPSHMWGGTAEEFFELYRVAATAIKAEFPALKIGGAGFWKINPTYGAGDNQFIDKFLAGCRDHRVPLDFFSWHSYGSRKNPFGMNEEPFTARKLLDSYGFPQTELHLNEWHYVEQWDSRFFHEGGLSTIQCAVHAVAVITAWQDTPLDMANYYTIGRGGAFSAWYPWGEKNRIYYAFLALAAMNRHADRIAAACEEENIFVLAGKNREGKAAILISDFYAETDELVLNTDGRNFRVKLLDENSNLEEISCTVENNRLHLPVISGTTALWLIEEI